MAKEYSTDFVVTSLGIVESLDPGERKTGKYLYDDLEPLLIHKESISIAHVSLVNASQFHAVMADLTRKARDQGLRPILHLEIHGLDSRDGLILLPSREKVTWDEFATLARELNTATKNNLLVVMAVCHGFYAALSVKLTQVTPFCHLIAPQERVSNQDIVSAFSPFYRELFSTNDVEAASKLLPRAYRRYTCEELLVNACGRYFREACMGENRRLRVEDLVTRFKRMRQDIPLRQVRRFFKDFTRPTADVFERYRRSFLMADDPENAGRFTVTYDGVMRAVRGES